MPLVGIPVDRLKKLLGQKVGRDELRLALENLGNDVEGYARVIRYRCERCDHITEALEHEDFNNCCSGCDCDKLVEIGSSEVVRIDLLPVRPDMLDAAGLARALRGSLEIETGLREWQTKPSGYAVEVKPGMDEIRPHIVAAVVRGLELDDESLRMLMKMQENLHWALGRDRRRASIGVYDLGTVKPGFAFRPVEPDELKFVPLFGLPDDPKAELTPREVLERHPKGTEYAHLLKDMTAYPLLVDSEDRVLSMPPIINSDGTKVAADTTDVFIDVTGPDRNAITRSLNVLVGALGDMGGEIETVEVRYPDGRTETTPDLGPGEMTIEPAEANRVLGLGLDAKETARCLEKLRYGATVDGDRVNVLVPAYRSDILHAQDVIEDVGIGYGFTNIEPRLVPTMTVSRPHPVEEVSEAARRVMNGMGILEVMTGVLTSERVQFELMRLEEKPHVTLANPATVEQTMARTSLVPGLLAVLRENSTREMPQQIYECDDVMEPDPEAETGVRTYRRLAAALCGPKASFADGRALISALARELGVEPSFSGNEHPSFIPGRYAEVRTGSGEECRPWGVLGEVHPEVLVGFAITQPVTVFEVGLDGTGR